MKLSSVYSVYYNLFYSRNTVCSSKDTEHKLSLVFFCLLTKSTHSLPKGVPIWKLYLGTDYGTTSKPACYFESVIPKSGGILAV